MTRSLRTQHGVCDVGVHLLIENYEIICELKVTINYIVQGSKPDMAIWEVK